MYSPLSQPLAADFVWHRGTGEVIHSLTNYKQSQSDLLKLLTARYGGRFTDLLSDASELSWGIWASITTDGQAVLVDGIAKSKVTLKEGSVVVLLGPVGGG